MTVPTVYKSTDTSAPVLQGVRGSLISVLTACLVDGYGSKSAAGWTRPFSNIAETQAAFRNSGVTGTGFYVAVDESTTTYAYAPSIKTYESMLSEIDGLLPIATIYNSSASISATANTTARPWVLIATDTWMYLFVYANATAMPSTKAEVITACNYALACFLGDFEKLYPSDGFNFLSASSMAKASAAQASFGCAGTGVDAIPATNYMFLARNLAGDTGSVATINMLSAPHGCSLNYAYGGTYTMPYTDGVTPLLFAKLQISAGTTYSLRGFMPGVLAPLTKHPYTNLQQVTVDTEDYIYVMWRTGYGSEDFLAGLLFRLSA